MLILKKTVIIASIVVFIICFYSFLLGNGVFAGKFENESIAWYILAKGIFCSLVLYLLARIIEAINSLRNNE
ncbi:MAG: LCI fold-containing protein [Spirochaetota bacterium]